jgi:hypothetical protein
MMITMALCFCTRRICYVSPNMKSEMQNDTMAWGYSWNRVTIHKAKTWSKVAICSSSSSAIINNLRNILSGCCSCHSRDKYMHWHENICIYVQLLYVSKSGTLTTKSEQIIHLHILETDYFLNQIWTNYPSTHFGNILLSESNLGMS